ncbi:hypothetical protein PROFUN_15697 [Planoprotostelium fungivorum]|uniref:Uncharacterized protein n=1 Tax=Planoprotostelium fungivorum TaxID=1890364 RepID=A0A2P6MUR6_9EUKA|nr:hypothetical protein PROFUN_15697 [Planoprotostelium fungivorum]
MLSLHPQNCNSSIIRTQCNGRHKKKHKARNNACLTTLWFSKQADGNRNTTLKAHPQTPVSHATVWQGYYHLGCSVFYPVCIKHALSTQKLINVLQRMYKLMTGSKHSVYFSQMESPRNHRFYAGEEDGVKLVWNNQFDEAYEFFKQQSSVKPRHALHMAEDPTDRAAALACDLAEQHLKLYERGIMPDRTETNTQLMRNHELDTKAVIGDCQTLSAALQVLDDKKLAAVMMLRKAWKTYESAIKQIDKSLSAQERIFEPAVISSVRFGAGLLYILISMIPPGFAQQAASFIGFKANKKLGLEYLWSTYSTSTSIRSDFAGLIIALNNVILSATTDKSDLQPFKDAEQILNKSIANHPKGSIFYLIRGLIAGEFNMNERAIEDIQLAEKNAAHVTKNPPIILRCLSNWSSYFVDMDWAAGADVLIRMAYSSEESVKKTGSPNQASWSKVWHELKLGSVYIALKKEQEAHDLFKTVSKSKEIDRWTSVIIKTARRFLRTGGQLSYYELMLFTTQFDRLLLSGDVTKRERILSSLEDIAKRSPGAELPLPLKELTKHRKTTLIGTLSLGMIGGSDENDPRLDNRVSYLILKGVTLRSIDRNDEAITVFQEVIGYKQAFNDHLFLAMAYLELGKSLVKTNPTEAVKMWKEGIKLNGYMWEDSTKQRLKTYINITSGEEVEVEVEPIEEEKK